MASGEYVGKIGLKSVGVLIFVHEHVKEMLLEHGADALLGLEQLESIDQKVVEIHRIQLQLARGVERGDLLYVLRLEAGSLGLPAARYVGHRTLLVCGLGQHLRDDILLREVLRILEVGLYDLANELLLVVLVEYLKARLIAYRIAISAQQAGAYGVEGAGPYGRHLGADDLFGAFKHLAGSAVGEGEKKYAVRVDAVFDEVCHAVHESASLAGSGGGQHEQRAIAGRGGLELFLVQQFREIGHRRILYHTPLTCGTEKRIIHTCFRSERSAVW